MVPLSKKILMQFKLEVTDIKSSARAGEISTDHGKIETPIFMPVGTAGTVKGVHIKDVRDDIKADIILGNTYHLYLRPGLDVIEQSGGLHKFNGWDRPMLTDSGGYQVYSLSDRRKLDENGVIFQSHIDGSRHNFTPENVMDIQRVIGADIIMAFDECTPYPCDYDYAKKSMGITHRWLDRCINRFYETSPKYDYDQTLFPIVQGSTFRDLRKESAEYIASKGAEGNALESIALGVDMFDCVMPTRNGRNGMLFTKNGIINIKNEKWKNDFTSIDEEGDSFVDLAYSKAYLRHLFIAKELLGGMIASQHNLSFYLWLVREARKHIMEGDFAVWKNSMSERVARRL